jgi:hypothetical protein
MAALCGLTTTLSASNYYVSTSGSNSNPGTLAQPFRTVQRAATIMLAGDTCYIRGGTYHEAVVASNLVGSAQLPITFRSYNDETVKFDGTKALTELGSTGWVQQSGSIYKTTLNQDVWQIFDDGAMMIPARWPNASFPPCS